MIDVLVVDDDFMVARINGTFVDQVDGFRVIGTAHTGKEALAAAETLHPDLVLLDLYLPDVFGLDVITHLRARQVDCDVIVISAARELDTVRRAARHGVTSYLLKPFDLADLRTRLERYRAQRGAGLAEVAGCQADVDRVLAGGGPARAPALPKGLSVETAELVRQALRGSDESLSATECAELVGLSRVSARRYLEHFMTTGQVDVTLKYGVTGRPERRYRWQAR
ncbi:response regulator [Nonomuraea sp. NPDC050790]|uniref:response regulator n=1 Tax=Nonomuraea sp. NPDC050790 TaxID=3364371 RepID=UPI00378A884B